MEKKDFMLTIDLRSFGVFSFNAKQFNIPIVGLKFCADEECYDVTVCCRPEELFYLGWAYGSLKHLAKEDNINEIL